jgi:peptidylprolyl isomerase
VSTRRQRDEAAMALASLFPEKAAAMLKANLERGNLSEESYVRALGAMRKENVLDELRPFTKSNSGVIHRVALEAALNHLSVESSGEIRGMMVEALSSTDMAVLTTAAAGLSDSLLIDSSSSGPLLGTLSRLRTPDDVEPMVAIIQTLGLLGTTSAIPVLELLLADSDRTVAQEAAKALARITGNSYEEMISRSVRPPYVDYDWAVIDSISKHPMVEVFTSKGRFRVEMFPDEAPFTCLSFYRLIARGFYDGLTFHRVVPNFVIQGGDPRGDGWGGPGYAIRSELGYREYDRGMVGVASAGKDTEGCQFFVTHSRQPHLDGRYTIFGRVLEGMDVVDRIQVGDTVVTIRMLESF